MDEAGSEDGVRGNKGEAFVISLPCAGGTEKILKGEAFRILCPTRTADKGSQLPLSIPTLMGEERTAVLSGFVYETSSPRDPLTFPGLRRELCSASRNMRKSPCGTFFGLAAAADISRSAVETRSMGWGQNISIPLFCIKHSKTIWIQPIRFSSVWFERYVRLESEYVRDDEADSFAFRRRVLDMRVSIAAFRPKKSVHGLFCMFKLAEPSPREAL